MTVPDQYPELPPGVAPRMAGIASEFAAIRHGAEEAGRRSPPVITFPPFPVIPASSPPETSTTVPSAAFVTPWTNFGSGYAPAAYQTIGSRVFLRGVVTTSTNLTGPFAIFHLPAGLRPAGQEPFICDTGGGSAIRVDIYPADGAVAIGPNTSIAAGGIVFLSGINFSTLA